MESKKLKVHVAEIFPLAEVKKAHTLCETGHVKGKVVLEIEK